MRAVRLIVLAIVALAGALLAPGTAGAHDMNATVTVGPARIRAEVYFEEDLPAECAAVRVTDAAGTEVAAGTTDARGVWEFAAPGPGEYRLTAKHTGHVATVKFSVAAVPAPAVDVSGAVPPVSYTGWRLNKAVGLAVGAGGLLSTSALFWFLRRRRELE